MNSKEMPYVANYPPLDKFLRQHEARCDWQIRLGGDEDEPTGYVEQHRLPNGRICIVVVHARGHGWNIFTDGGAEHIDATLADAAERLGVAP